MVQRKNPGRQGRVRDEKLSVAMIVEALRRPGMAVLAFEPGRSLLLEQEACETLVKKNKLSVLTVGWGRGRNRSPNQVVEF